jgi:uridylate kinase
MKEKIKIISVGGSIIIPKTGFDLEFLKKFRQLILDEVKKGYKFVLVIGGGGTCRAYQTAAKGVVKLSDEDLDRLGIYATHFNAEFVRALFGDQAYAEVVKNPTKKIKTDKPIILAGGWEPGNSTDYIAVLLAKNVGSKEVINLSDFDYVYSADPKKDSTAKPYKQLSWVEMRKIVGEKWNPGVNLPFDPLAAKEAQKLGLKVTFVRGTDLAEVKKAIAKQSFQGTIVVN